MSDLLELADADFAAQMRGLIDEAERALSDRSAGSRPAPAPEAPAPAPAAVEIPPAAPEPAARPQPNVAEMLRPLVQGVQAIGRATGEHTQILGKLDKVANDSVEAQKELPQIVLELKTLLEQRNNVSRQMFDALHEELKTYKDGFLLDSLHRPMIRDLITLYDDLAHIHLQMQEAVSSHRGPDAPGGETPGNFQRLHSIEVHIEHNLHFILEVLARLEVQQLPKGVGKLDKLTQRAMSVEMADDPEQDMDISRTLKRGFLWKDRVVRAEEVVIKKWKEGFLVALPPSPA